MKAAELTERLMRLGDPGIAAHSKRFFKTGPGEYGEGDRFLGIRVPVLRREAGRQRELPLRETLKLLQSPFHEVRLLALLLMVQRFETGDAAQRTTLYQHYLEQTDRINNWVLVDSSAPRIVGGYLEQRDRRILSRLIESDSLWERRTALMACLHFIRQNDFDPEIN